MPLRPCGPEPCPLQLRRPSGPTRLLSKQVLAALGRALEHIVGLGIAIKTKQTEYRTGTAAQNVQLFVRCNKVVREQRRRHMGVRQQAIVVQAFRNHGQGIDDRAQPGGAADAQGPRHARCVPAFQAFAKMRYPGQRKFA